jgi:hypothetical protein
MYSCQPPRSFWIRAKQYTPPADHLRSRRRNPPTLGHRAQAYYRRKLAEGKSPKEALRCLKRRLSDAIYRCLVTDQQRNVAEVTS